MQSRQWLAQNLFEQLFQAVSDCPALELGEGEDGQDKLPGAEIVVKPALLHEPLKEAHGLAYNAAFVSPVVDNDETKKIGIRPLFEVKALSGQALPTQRKLLSQLGIGD